MLAPDTTPSVERAHSLAPEPVAEASRPFPADGHAATASSTAGTASASGAAGTAASVPATPQPSRLQPSALRNGDTLAGAPLMAVPVQVPAPMPEEPDPHAAPPREWVVFNLGGADLCAGREPGARNRAPAAHGTDAARTADAGGHGKFARHRRPGLRYCPAARMAARSTRRAGPRHCH